MKEIADIDSFTAWTCSHRPPVALRDLDLRAFGSALADGRVTGCLFLGCTLSAETAGNLVARGAVVIPDDDELLHSVHRATLYSPDEVFTGFDETGDYKLSWDGQVYAEYVAGGRAEPGSIRVSLARRLHDHSISEALADFVRDRRVVAIMGGHSMERRDPMYEKIARVARSLTRRGYTIATGGGPGAMEAGHLGAWLASSADDDLERALAILSVRGEGAAPGREYADDDWLHRAWRVRQLFGPDPTDRVRCESVGIPTWFYGHEPPAVFATHIAKYFANGVREEGLLSIAHHGVVFAPGGAGTLQEIFQDAAQNRYGTTGYYSPMILMGRSFWAEEMPVWPLLQRLAAGREFSNLIFIADEEDQVLQHINDWDAERWRA